MKKVFFVLSTTLLLLQSCIKDDFIDDMVSARLIINSPIENLKIGDSYQYQATYFDKVGQEKDIQLTWLSSDTSIIQINSAGLALAIKKGFSIISVSGFDSDNIQILSQDTVTVSDSTIFENKVKTGIIATTSSYELKGEFTLNEVENDLLLSIKDNYSASTQLPGLYVYLSNNPNTIENAHEIGAVSVFKGAHSYTVPNKKITNYKYVLYYCKPFNVKVGHGEIQ